MATGRSARGEIVDFELLAIKSQLAATPVPRHTEDRKRAIDAKDGVKTDQLPDLAFLQVASTAAKASEDAVPAEPRSKTKTASQIARK